MTNARTVHTNRLIDATSPYLLQHAHNPVDWYPWGKEALERAHRENRPIFLSIGYAACHWCHVMERESFENEEIAAILNQHFVAIKVDREERPDLDEIYMNATMLANRGQGGWPMSVFLTPEQKPFFAGTYFPPTSRYGRPGFKDILLSIAEAWRDRRDDVYSSADNLVEAMSRFTEMPESDAAIPPDLVSTAAERLARAFDPRTGGMLSGQTNKFPPSMAMTLMLREYHQTKRVGAPKAILLERVELTLDHMAGGGIYDHLGGGIARYSTDPDWLVPHFEKMLYDQALVSGVYIEANLLTGHERYATVAKDIFDYVLADLRSAEGGFYSTRDADSEGVEGKYYVWSKEEILSALGEQAGELFCSYYDVTEAGNWGGHNILNVQRDLETVAKLNDIDPDALRQSLDASRAKLLAVRGKRVPPALDDKILTAWNGLMIASLARGGRISGERKYIRAAEKAGAFVLRHLTRDGRLLRTYRKGKAHTLGYLDDYAFFVEGLLDLYEATFDRRWLAEALRLNDDMITHFWDESGGGFFFTADDSEKLILRNKDSHDGAIPAGNSVALMNLLRLSLMLGRADLRDKAERTITAFAGKVTEYPHGFDRFLQAVAFRDGKPREIAIVGSPRDPGTVALVAAVNRVYDPHRVVMLLDPEESGSAAWAETIPLLRGKMLVDQKPAVYICRDYTCRRPVTDVDQVIAQLKAD
jgi:uncharacterized protein YyaL (SSP411 family)